MKVKALQKYYYGGREYQPGESFEMDDREDIRVLCDLGQLERVSAEAAAEARQETPNQQRVARGLPPIEPLPPPKQEPAEEAPKHEPYGRLKEND